MKIVIPQLNTLEAIRFCAELAGYDDYPSYLLDSSRVSNFEPFGMLLTSAAIRQFHSKHSKVCDNFSLVHGKDSNSTYACHMGYFRSFGVPYGKEPGEAPGSGTYIPLTEIDIKKWMQEAIEEGKFLDQVDIIEERSAELAHILGRNNNELCKLFQYLIREAIRNVPEHAETNKVWICGQYWGNRNGRPAEIAILDEGVGVMNSICKNRRHREYISSNWEALEWVLKPGVSKSFDPSRGNNVGTQNGNSGYGLYVMSEICKMLNGKFTILSGGDCIRIFPRSRQHLVTSFNGTALAIRINTDEITDYKSLIKAACDRGKDAAKTIKNAFKEASVPSKGLLHDDF